MVRFRRVLCLVARFDDQIIRWPRPHEEARLGSSPGNDFILPAPGVSRTHARIIPREEGLGLVDLGSKNGLIAGGARVEEALLTRGSEVQIGRALLRIEDADTSEVRLAIRMTQRAAGAVEAERDTEVGNGDDPAALALRFVRLNEARRGKFSGARRQKFLESARAILGSGSLVLMHVAPDGSISFMNVAGSLPDAPALAQVAGARPPKRRAPVVADALIGDAPLLLLRKGALATAATFAPGAAVEAWARDFFGYVAEKVLGSDFEAPVDAEPRSGSDLVIPEGMVPGESPAMRSLLGQIAATVNSRLDVLLLGETGTGKELVARLIHASGPTAGGPFVAINCAAIPSELLESELFGVIGRVATGVDPRQGLFVRADGGSILLDEISEMPDRLQAKLLRVIQEREVLAIGASAPRKIDVRAIAASNRDLLAFVEAGTFRRDLFYRLRGLQFHVPPLRERREDIAPLVIEFIDRAVREYGKPILGVSQRALTLLMEHAWPGNVRELESEIRRAVLVCPAGAVLTPDHLGPVRWAVAAKQATAPPADAGVGTGWAGPSPSADGPFEDLQARVDAVERAAIEQALAAANGNRSKAARLLGITRNGLAMKMARLGIKA
ncbi:MAG TPA: sigma 54-interacting transcriptional regulator [Thermoanaerobaculia bacterium]